MTKTVSMSMQTRQNWLIDAAVFSGALLALLSGIYFLFLPVGGYQGGRNPAYGITILFSRHTWDDLHTWGGIMMILAVALHVTIHWSWIKTMSRRAWRAALGGGHSLPKGARLNVAIDLCIAASFFLCAISGIYFLLTPSGAHAAGGPVILWTRATWDLVRTWSGVVMALAAAVHLFIHWGWITKVTSRFFKSLRPQIAGQAAQS